MLVGGSILQGWTLFSHCHFILLVCVCMCVWEGGDLHLFFFVCSHVRCYILPLFCTYYVNYVSKLLMQ
jgi:hypothetical protein